MPRPSAYPSCVASRARLLEAKWQGEVVMTDDRNGLTASWGGLGGVTFSSMIVINGTLFIYIIICVIRQLRGGIVERVIEAQCYM